MSVRIAILVEGSTEQAFKRPLQAFLRQQLSGQMPKLDFAPQQGRLPKGRQLKKLVQNLLDDNKQPADAVIALTDVYTGSNPPEFATAEEAKRKLREWVGEVPKFHPHVALHDFEAWLLPYWPRIIELAGSNHRSPGAQPEQVNHGHPPSKRLAEVFRAGSNGHTYSKRLYVGRILDGQNLLVSINACPEFKAFVNTILELSGGTRIA